MKTILFASMLFVCGTVFAGQPRILNFGYADSASLWESAYPTGPAFEDHMTTVVIDFENVSGFIEIDWGGGNKSFVAPDQNGVYATRHRFEKPGAYRIAITFTGNQGKTRTVTKVLRLKRLR